MGIYVYSVKATTVNTKLGINFHPTRFAYRYVPYDMPFAPKKPKHVALCHARMSRFEDIMDQNPERWSTYIGVSVHGHEQDDESKMHDGIIVRIYKQDHPISNWLDTHDPGEYVCDLQKQGRKWVRGKMDNRTFEFIKEQDD